MRTSIFLRMATANLIQAAMGNPVPKYRRARPSPALNDYGIDEIQWSFKPPFGEPVLMNGTIQDLESSLGNIGITHLDQRHRIMWPATNGQKESVAKNTTLVKFCGVFPMANSHHVTAQVPTIVAVSGPAVIGPGPGNCAQVSCTQDSGIWWCNDRNTTIMLPQGTEELGNAVDAVLDQCCSKTDCQSSPGFPISGQAFSNEGWNIMVRGEVC